LFFAIWMSMSVMLTFAMLMFAMLMLAAKKYRVLKWRHALSLIVNNEARGMCCSSSYCHARVTRVVCAVAAAGLRIWGGHLRGELIYFLGGGQDRIFKKVLLFAHAVVTGLLSPPPRRFAPSQKGAIFLGIPPPGDEYPRNIGPPEGMPQEYRPPPLGYSPPIYAMWFIQIISWYCHLMSALRPIQTERYLATRREFSVFNDI
jgi:hypothetical protein